MIQRGASLLTEITIDIGPVNGRAKESDHDYQAIDKPEYDQSRPSGRMKLVEQQRKGLRRNHLCD